MSKYNVLYIDDDASKHGLSQIEPMIDTLEENETLSIKPFQSGPFDKISKKILEVIGDYDAVIFDYQLDDRANDDGETGNVKAPVLAQHLRTEATNTEKEIKDVPFILCSTDDKLQKSYTADHTSHDLFDLRFRKDKENFLTVSDQIVALIEGYDKIRKSKDLSDVLNTDLTSLDDRIFSRFINNPNAPAHELARTILKDLIYIEGPLISEEILAARLGIDRSSPDWNSLLKDFFFEAKFKGAFANGWNRWWMNLVNNIFKDLTGSNLASLDALERLEGIKVNTGLNLSVSERIETCKSYRYWTLCKSFNKPLDPREGFRIAMKTEPKPWQDYSYISKHGAVNRIGFDEGLDVHPSEYERYRLLIEELKNEKK
ncbi:hypothetical protein [Salegentibacter sp. UBA1130]|uniref:hypothetical protein n=1 Tax=Salegentibacter sp. UBA1130 TaxID=1947451 RepID=UPI002580FDDF|nr:hypothetical protein [Salegentibacter sp. UBA1130]